MTCLDASHRGRALMGVLAAAMLVCGCHKPTPPPSRNTQRIGVPEIDGHGIAIRYYDTNEPLERVHEVIESCPGERLTDEVWAAHGLEIIRLRETDLVGVESRLPASNPPGLLWHGQAVTWRNLFPPGVPVGDRAMVTGDSTERFPGGTVGMAGRGWSMMTLDGPRVQLELAPLVETPSLSTDRFNHLRREFLVGPGDVLLLVAGSGQWPHPPPENTSVEGLERARATGTMGQLLLEVDSDVGTSCRLMMVTPHFGEWDPGRHGVEAVGNKAAAR